MAVETQVAVSHAFDPRYEFDAPHFYDFDVPESEEEVRAAQLWFGGDHTYAPSPFIMKIKKETLVKLGIHEESGSSKDGVECCSTGEANSEEQAMAEAAVVRREEQAVLDDNCAPMCEDDDEHRISQDESHARDATNVLTKSNHKSLSSVNKEMCTPRANRAPLQGNMKMQKEKENGSSVQKPSALQSKNNTQVVDKSAKSAKPKNLPLSSAHMKGLTSTVRSVKKASDVAQENQAIKKQKLDDGKFRRILDVKARIFTHKSTLGLTTANDASTVSKPNKDENKDTSQRKIYARDQVKVNPFVSAAEIVQKFNSSIRKVERPCTNKSLSHEDSHAALQSRPVLRWTQPTEPELQTSQRIRSVKVKSTAEIEEELLAIMPKFKARPVNKKMFEAPKLPPTPRRTPQPPEFQEFHLKTMERATQNSGTVTPSVSTSYENHNKILKLTEPRSPRLETSCRARPTKRKTTEEMQLEELEKVPQFKARPLDKKILESKRDVGLTRTCKRQHTVPQEFHFATDERLPPLKSVEHMFEKLSLNLEPQRDQQQLPRITTPNPFHLHTEERGLIKEKRFAEEQLQKQFEEERARIRKANPYPYSTDIPVIPPKRAPKVCTKPEAFQLQSLVRHEEEVQKQMEERQTTEKEEARNRIFKAAPIMREDPIPLPQKERIPLTKVQEFVLHVEHRAVDRAEYDKKIIEKEMMYKRLREEYELHQKIEDEKALKQMRRTMVPHARPTPNFANPFLPQKSPKEVTEAKHPELRVLHRRRLATVSQMR